MLCFALDGHRTGHGAVGFDQLVGREGRTALFALVAISPVIAALGAGSDDIAVGQEGLRLLVVILHGGLFDELALVIEFPEEGRSSLGMSFRRGARIDVERHAEPLERLLDEFMVAVDDLLGRNALLAGLDGDGHTVFVGSADRNHVAALEPQITGINIRRYVDSRQVADMYGTVGIGECRCHKIAFELFCHKQNRNC